MEGMNGERESLSGEPESFPCPGCGHEIGPVRNVLLTRSREAFSCLRCGAGSARMVYSAGREEEHKVAMEFDCDCCGEPFEETIAPVKAACTSCHQAYLVYDCTQD